MRIGINVGAGLDFEQGALTVDETYVSTLGTGASASSVETVLFNLSGDIYPLTGVSRWYPYGNIALVKAYFSVDLPPTTTDIVIQLRKNGVVIPSSELTCLVGEHKSNELALTTLLTPTDYITMDVLSGNTGTTINVVLVYNVETTGLNTTALIPQTKATGNTLGMVKVGDGLAIDPFGVLSATGNATSSMETVGFNLAGDVVPLEGVSRWYPPTNIALAKFYFSIDVPSGDGDITLRLRINGEPVPSSAITCTQGTHKSSMAVLALPALTPNDFITVDILNGTSGKNIYAVLVYNVNTPFTNSTAIPPEYLASTTQLGMVQIGEGISVSNGVISVATGGNYTLPIASDTTLGGIKVGTGLAIDVDGVVTTTGGGVSTVVNPLMITEQWFTTHTLDVPVIDNISVFNGDYYFDTTVLNTANVTNIEFTPSKGINSGMLFFTGADQLNATMGVNLSTANLTDGDACTTLLTVTNDTSYELPLDIEGLGGVTLASTESKTFLHIVTHSGNTYTMDLTKEAGTGGTSLTVDPVNAVITTDSGVLDVSTANGAFKGYSTAFYSKTDTYLPTVMTKQLDVRVPVFAELALGVPVAGAKKLYQTPSNNVCMLYYVEVYADVVDDVTPLELAITLQRNRNVSNTDGESIEHTQEYLTPHEMLLTSDWTTYQTTVAVPFDPVEVDGVVCGYKGVIGVYDGGFDGTMTPPVNTQTGLPSASQILYPVDKQSYLWYGEYMLLKVVSAGAFSGVTVRLNIVTADTFEF